MALTHREHLVARTRDRYVLTVTDRPVLRYLAEVVIEHGMAALGHPCCGRGAGRLPFVHAPANALLYGVLTWASRRDRCIEDIPLTEGQARALNPGFIEWWTSEDDEDDA